MENYRHDPSASQSKAIEELCNKELVAELATDIAARGALSPLEVMAVVPLEGHPGHYVAVEGNRRTCALIVLQDPSRAPQALQSRLKRIAAKANLPKNIKVHVFSDKQDAKQWIDLRHLGEQAGVGTRVWNPTQQQRAAGTNNKTTARDNTLAVLALDRLEARGLLTAKQRRQVSVSTMTRYLGTPSVRAILGLDNNLRELIYTHAPDEVDNALLQLALDIITPQEDGVHAANSRTNSKQRLQYANEMKARGDAPTTHLETAQPPPTATKARSQQERTGGSQSRNSRDPDKRKYLLPGDFVISLGDPVLARLRKEASTLDPDEYSFSVNYLLRAILEQVMTLFVRKRGKWRPNMTDSALTQACAQELDAIGVLGKALSVPRKAGGDDSTAYSLHSLGHAVHGGSNPTGKDLKKHFDTWRPALEAMLATLATPKKRAP
ncbi:hypothetical protein LDO31_18795 [Luteimonas sp. XNQY3]|nr:hypothetical protein [Luteimonas sp. XNQY3]